MNKESEVTRFQFRIRFPMLAMGIFALLTGIWGGLQRVGWVLPAFETSWVLSHGPLMVCGFLGTVIGMERAVAQNKLFYYLSPFFTGLGAILLLIGVASSLPAILITAGSLVLVINFSLVLKQFPSMYAGVMALGAVVFFMGNILWLSGFPIPNIVLWWAGFLILTIAGERLELSRLLQPSPGVKNFFYLSTLILLAGIITATFDFSTGMRVAGVGMILLAYWLLRYDLAKKSVKQAGLPKFIALALIVGYVWLGISGILALVFGNTQAGPHYDGILHAVFLGFVFSMIFGHAPIIFPAILKVKMDFKNRFYLHLGLLHLSLLLRLTADLSGWIDGRFWGSMFNGIAVLLFFINTISSVKRDGSH